MRIYAPDAWIILKAFNKATGVNVYKVLGGWYGGFAKADSWRLSSSIERVEEGEELGTYNVHNYSGSMYRCHVDSERTTMLMLSILGQLKDEAGAEGTHEVTHVSMQELLKVLVDGRVPE